MSDWFAATLAAIDDGLGFRRSSLLLVLVSDGRTAARAFAGATHGPDVGVLGDYFERWASADPLATDAARERFARTGIASTSELYPGLDPPQRRFVDEFLSSIGIADQLSMRLPGNGVSDGYLTVHEPRIIGRSERAQFEGLAPGLARQLRRFLPHGLSGPLSARERQAAELVAFGLTNAQIAAVLSVGVDTVKKHLFQAMAKLGIERRTQLAVSWTTGHRLPTPLTQPPA
jgi:DNA-binding CsgD family transcriptional regulator